ncbi:MAG: transcriptional regulator with XRE-family HTH domain [Myxococcota bacterium]|jgi:transcriptional regulator with XRE-family HTH domain
MCAGLRYKPFMVDVEQLCRQLVRTLRGDRSQRALSRRLQYTTNIVYLWESGRRWPSAATFFWLAHRTGCAVSSVLEGWIPGEAGAEPWKTESVAALMRRLQGTTPATVIAAKMGLSRDVVGRWLRGSSEPKLPDLLRFVEVTSARMLDFVALFADPGALPAAAQDWRVLEAARLLARDQPWAPAVLLALELADYQSLPTHRDDWVAARLSLPVAVVSECLTLLREAGQIRSVGGRWQRLEVQAVDSRIPSRPTDLKRWWTGVALSRMEAAEGVASFTICAVSEHDFGRIQQLQRRYYRDLRALIAASTPSQRIVLLNLHALAIDQP